MKVYLIFGHTGEQADYTKWLVRKCFVKHQSALDYCNNLNDNLKELGVHYDSDDSYDNYINRREKIIKKLSKLDPDFQFDYTGARYEIEEAERED